MIELPRIITLMYHRIDDKDTDPWGICVSPEHFDGQIELIRQRYPIITIDEAIRQVISGNIPQTSVCLTFDDGYADNYINALPVLKNYNCPAAFFIATAFTGSTIPFWWDELEMICLHAKHLPANLPLSLNNLAYTFSFETSLTKSQWQKHLNWKWYETSPTARCDSFLRIWNLLRPLPYHAIEVAMIKIRAWANAGIHCRLLMTKHQLQNLCREKHVTIGLHTHTHADLSSGSQEAQQEEILAGKEILFKKYGIESSVLAYPYGNFTEITLSVVENLGLSGCFTTRPFAITTRSDIYDLGRFQAGDWNAHQFNEKLLKWTQE